MQEFFAGQFLAEVIVWVGVRFVLVGDLYASLCIVGTPLRQGATAHAATERAHGNTYYTDVQKTLAVKSWNGGGGLVGLSLRRRVGVPSLTRRVGVHW